MNLIDQKVLEAAIRAKLADGVLAGLEPIIKQAVVEAEKEIRKQIGTIALSILEHNYEIFSDTNRLVITVKHTKGCD